MKKWTKVSTFMLAGVASLSLVAAPLALAAPGELSDAEAATLAYNREEERLARDLYQAIADQYDGARPFAQITRAEQQHFDSVGILLTNYGLADPSAGMPAGQYSDPELQALYDNWFAQAQGSLEQAYQVGIELETQDIADLDEAIAGATAEDVKATLERLKAGSQKHLTAYQRAADRTLGDGSRTARSGLAGAGMRAKNGPGVGGSARNGNGDCDGSCDGTGVGPQQAKAKGTNPRGTGQGGTGQGGANERGTGQGAADGSGPLSGSNCPLAG